MGQNPGASGSADSREIRLCGINRRLAHVRDIELPDGLSIRAQRAPLMSWEMSSNANISIMLQHVSERNLLSHKTVGHRASHY